jgi:hypothetical protein
MASKGKTMKKVVVAIEEGHKHEMGKVIGKLKKKGFVLSESLEAIGVLTGSVPLDGSHDLKDVEGVKTVEDVREDYKPQ